MPDETGHLAAYHDTFGQAFGVGAGSLPSRLIIVLFTNRCGSMLFTEMIGSSPDIITTYEVFNGDVVASRAGKWGAATFHDYLTKIFGRPRVTYTAKIHAVQLGFLARAGLIRAFSGGVTAFRVRRRDQIAQAVSHSIARQTGQWTSFSGGTGQARYDFNELRAILTAIRREQDLLDRQIDAVGLDVRDVVFEDFLQAPGDVLVPVWNRLGVRPGRPDLSQTRHRQQATDLNSAFIDRFRSDLARCDPVAAA